MQLPMTSLCWNPLIMANILSILNSVREGKKKEKTAEPRAQIFCRNKKEKKIERLYKKLLLMYQTAPIFFF